MKAKLRIAGVVALILAALSASAESQFYGDISPDGVVQESFFLPLAVILGAIGLALLAVSLVQRARA